MSTSEKPDHARGWLYVEKLLNDEDDESARSPSDAELPDEGDDAGTEWSADDLLARAEAEAAKRPPNAARANPAAPLSPTATLTQASPREKVAPVVPIRKTWRAAALLAAACLALFLGVKMTQGPDIVAHPPSNRELAEARRSAAEASCTRKDWAACRKSLDEAATLDPAGESEPRVQKARQEIAAGQAEP